MAEKKTNSKELKAKDPKKAAKEAAKAPAKHSNSEAKEEKSKMPTAAIAIIVIVVLAIVAYLLLSQSSLISSVPFSTYKANAQSSPRLSITATYGNQTQLSDESICFASIIQIVAHSRKASTIDFYIINNENNTCTYSNTGLGGNVNPTTTNSSYCLTQAYSEDGLFLNYSATNSTLITSNRMFVYGNAAYLAACPIAIELS